MSDAPKPDLALLIAKLQQIVNLDPSDERVRRECFMSNPPQHVAVVACQRIAREVIAGLSARTPPATLSEKCEAAVDRIVDRAMRGPQPSADDAAVLDKLVDLWDAACGDLATGPHVTAYRAHRAAVLARMSVLAGYKLVPVEPTDRMMQAVAEADALAPARVSGNPFALFKRLWLAAVAAAPTEVK